MIIAVSQLVGNNVLVSQSRFAESLSVISSYAANDKAMQVGCLLRLIINKTFSVGASTKHLVNIYLFSSGMQFMQI
jgi:hypothetical protein